MRIRELFLGLSIALAAAFPLRAQDAPPSLTIEGYAGQISYRPGEEVGLHISTTAPRYSLRVSRLGAEEEVVYTADDLPGSAHPIPEDASSHGCGWPVSHTLTIPDDWASGYYNVRLRATDNGGKFVGRARMYLEKIKAMVRNNPNMSILIGFGPDDFKE